VCSSGPGRALVGESDLTVGKDIRTGQSKRDAESSKSRPGGRGDAARSEKRGRRQSLQKTADEKGMVEPGRGRADGKAASSSNEQIDASTNRRTRDDKDCIAWKKILRNAKSDNEP